MKKLNPPWDFRFKQTGFGFSVIRIIEKVYISILFLVLLADIPNKVEMKYMDFYSKEGETGYIDIYC